MNKLVLSPEKMIADFQRTWIGVDEMMDAVRRMSSVDQGYPPHNVIKTGDESYNIELAVAGFDKSEITLEIENGSLVVRGEQEANETEYLYRGIATRAFVRSWYLGEHVEVKGAVIVNGMLVVELAREIPEAMKPKTIKIK